MGRRRHCTGRGVWEKRKSRVSAGVGVPLPPKLAPALGLTIEQLQDMRVSRQMPWPSLCLREREKSHPPPKPLWRLRLGALPLSSSSSIAGPAKQQKPSSSPPPPNPLCRGIGVEMGKRQDSEGLGESSFKPFAQTCDKLLEPTCARGGGLSCQPNAAGKGLNWQAGNEASRSVSTTSLWPMSSLF